MLALRTLRAAPLRLARGNATVAAGDTIPPIISAGKPSASTDSTFPTASTTEPGPSTTQGRKRALPKKRPDISLANPREWKRPVAYGIIPAYDEALLYIMKDSSMLKKEAEELKASIVKADAGPQKEQDALEKMQEKLRVLEVQSEINIPEVRWNVANGMADMSRPVHRRLVEQRWRDEGKLDLLMERLHQMNIIPDVLGNLRPTVDLSLVLRGHPTPVEPGSFLTAGQTRKEPRLYPTVFHTDTRLYTLIMVDPDVPDEENQTFQTYLHWLKPNIPLSATSTSVLVDTSSHTPYLPPHPQQGTNYHRYTTLLIPQSEEISLPAFSKEERFNFDVREFVEQYGLDGTKGGAHMFREVWDSDVTNIYRDILGWVEPKFGRPKQEDRYAGRGKRYVS
ncbi:PEBP-like protein [Athelia psychrophila]|uniref:PEBP-like protein n=1 Tax=Athelia psychrophila TaxID=1759441 RepID=A0A166T9V4_9AGAM|nr:PEBP-like protein [Fibularhizoctonia sp. CBS 109695]